MAGCISWYRRAIRLILDDRAVHGDRFDPDAHDARLLQPREHPIEDAQFGPTVHAGVNRVPVAEVPGQAAPPTAVLGHVQDRIQNLQVGQADIASLARQTALDLIVLGRGDFHASTVNENDPLVLTAAVGLLPNSERLRV